MMQSGALFSSIRSSFRVQLGNHIFPKALEFLLAAQIRHEAQPLLQRDLAMIRSDPKGRQIKTSFSQVSA